MQGRLLPFLAAVSVVLGQGNLPTQAESPPKNSPTQLIMRLGSRRFAEREAATRALDALGVQALPALQKAIHSEDLEIRRRATVLTVEINKRLERDRLLSAPKVHLIIHNQSVRAAFAEFNRKTGLGIQLDGSQAALGERRVSLDTGDTSIWDALDQLCRKSGVSEAAPKPARGSAAVSRRPVEYEVTTTGDVAYSGRGSRGRRGPRLQLRVMDGKAEPLPTSQMGAMRIRAMPPQVGVTGQSTDDTEKAFALEVCADPQLQCQSVVRLRIDAATDDRGHHLSQVVPPVHASPQTYVTRRFYSPTYGRMFSGARYVPVRLAAPKGTSTRLAELRGVVTAEVRTPPQAVLTVRDILKATGKEEKSGDAQLKVLEVKPSGRSLTLKLQLALPMQEANEFRRGLNMRRLGSGRDTEDFEDQLLLLDGHGKRLESRGRPQIYSIAGMADGGMVLEMETTYTAKAGQAAPAQLVYRAPRRIAIDVPFTLKNVPLP